MSELFDKDKRTISEHIKNIFKEGELQEDSVVLNFRTTAADGKNYQVVHYNLDVIISVGYRVSSHRGTQFRIWATQRLSDVLALMKEKYNVEPTLSTVYNTLKRADLVWITGRSIHPKADIRLFSKLQSRACARASPRPFPIKL